MQKTAVGAPPPAHGVPLVVTQALRAAGRPLDSASRSYFEPLFQHDFSQVSVHTGAQAAASARAVNALAYTVGHNVAFDTSRYAPHTAEGKRLLGHELAHVVQQSRGAAALSSSMPESGLEHEADRAADRALAGEPAHVEGIAGHRVSRVATTPGDFPVSGKLNAPGDTMNIYFDRNSAAIEASEQAKIPKIISSVTPAVPLVLNAFRSEDEPAALAGTRGAAVSSALGASKPPHTAAKTVAPQPGAGVGRIEYRQVRKVEVLAAPTGGPPPVSSVPSCAGGVTAPCNAATFNAAQTRALAMVSAAITQLSAAPLSANATSLLTTLFGGVGAAATVKTKLTNLRSHITAMASQHRCHNACDSGCGQPGYNCGVGIGVPAPDPCTTSGSKATMTLCPGFDATTNADERAELLVHEGSHGTAGLETVDLAYEVERKISILSPAQALRNTDSYVLLVRNLDTPGSVSIGPSPADVITGVGNCPAADPVICRAVAHLEKWAVTARQDIGFVYGDLVSALPPGAWPPVSYSRELLHDIAAGFGLTDPGAAAPFTAPTTDDKLKLAGIYDRYDQMMWQVYQNRVTVNKLPVGLAAIESWSVGAPATLTLTLSFAAIATEAGRVRRLFELLAMATPTVTSALRPSYVDAADRIRRKRGYGPT